MRSKKFPTEMDEKKGKKTPISVGNFFGPHFRVRDASEGKCSLVRVISNFLNSARKGPNPRSQFYSQSLDFLRVIGAALGAVQKTK